MEFSTFIPFYGNKNPNVRYFAHLENGKKKELKHDHDIPCGINCEYEYIVFCLQDKYDCEVVQFWDKHNEVYY